MTSFFLRECQHYAKEHSSKVFLCYLDGRQAFDNVWIDGLFYRLIEYGVDETTLLPLRDMYTNSRSRKKLQGLLSDEFPVLQGTRQGGKSSPMMYLVFINELIRELERSNFGMCLYGMNMCSPTVADDMVLVSFSKTGIEK